MNTQLLVDHTLARVRVHAGGPRMMMVVGIDRQTLGPVHSPHLRAFELPHDDVEDSLPGRLFLGSPAPAKDGLGQPKGVQSV